MRIALYSGLLVATTTTAPAQDADVLWAHFQKRYDKNGDQKITAEEHGRGEAQYKNLDKNGDGTVDALDFQRGPAPGGKNRRGQSKAEDNPEAQRASRARTVGEMFGSFLNTDGKPGLSKQDWAALRARLVVDEDGFIDGKSITVLTGLDGKTRMARMMNHQLEQALDFNRDNDVTVEELAEVFKSLDTNGDGTLQVGSEIQMPPGVGELAPDFTLPYADNAEKSVKLSSFRGKKPVALIFGSYT